MNLPNELQAELESLRQAYIAKLPAELNNLIHLTTQLSGSMQSDAGVLAQLERGLHKIAGSAGSFGMSKLTDRTRHLEQTISDLLDASTDSVYDIDQHESLSNAIHALAETSEFQDAAMPFSHLQTVQPSRVSEQLVCVASPDAAFNGLIDQLHTFGYQVTTIQQLSELSSGAEVDSMRVVLVDVDHLDLPEEPESQVNAWQDYLIALSDRDDFNVRHRVVHAGFDDYFSKKAEASEIVVALDRLLSHGGRTPERVLIIDDDDALLGLYRATLKSVGMQVEVLQQPDLVLEKLEQFHPDLLLMDLQMPTVSGRELAKIIRLYKKWSVLPIIFLSSETDIEQQASAVTAAFADDFLVKPVNEAMLIATVRSRIFRARQLNDMMLTDSLTGLMTHARIKDALAMELSRARRDEEPISLGMLDIDHFKKVNDQFGHPEGDRVISALSALLRHAFRKGDMKGRYGGEEFLVVFPKTSESEAFKLLERLRKGFENLSFGEGDDTFSCTLSAGMVCSSRWPEADAEQLIELADQAMYQAKRNGRNQVRCQASD